MLAGKYTYGPDGATSLSGSDSGNAAQFTGRPNDGSGLYYYRNRYYDPTTSRFISPDPSGLSGGTNPYECAADQPADLTDPLGLKPQGTVDESASTGTPPGGWVDPETINFSQRTVSPNDYVESMVDGTWDWNRAGTALRVIDRGGQLVSYDNRRLAAARMAAQVVQGYRVKVEHVNPGSPDPASTTGRTWDQSFERRMTSKRNRDPSGARVPPKDYTICRMEGAG